MTKSCIIIDDEHLARTLIRKYLAVFPEVEIVGEAADGFTGAQLIQKLKPDFVFVDVQMPKLNGFEMMELVEDPPHVIFTTAYHEHAVKAFEMNAIDYLLKPFSKERFEKALEKILRQNIDPLPQKQMLRKLAGETMLHEKPVERIVVKTVHSIKVIPVSQIRYIETQDDYVMIYTKDGKFLKQQSMKQVEALLDSREFVRIHRSYLLNIQEIVRIEPGEKLSYQVILKDNGTLPISRSGYTLLKEVLDF